MQDVKMNLKKGLMGIVTAAMMLAAPMTCFAADDTVTTTDTAGNCFVSGEDAKMIDGEYFAGYGAGKNVAAEGSKFTDGLALAGMDLSVKDSEVGASTYLAGNSISVNNTIMDGNLIAAGASLYVNGTSSMNSVIAVGSSVDFNGTSNALMVSAADVTIDGTVNGDAYITAENVTIGDDAVITGELKVISGNDPKMSDTASIGTYNYTKVETEEVEKVEKAVTGAVILAKIKSAFYWAIAMAVAGLILCWLFDDLLVDAKEMVKTRTAPMLVTGFCAMLILPAAFIIGMVTVVGIPTILILTGCFTLLICISTAFAGASLGRLVFPGMNYMLSSVIAIAILEIAKKIPYLGVLISIAAVIYTVGYFIQSLYLHRICKK